MADYTIIKREDADDVLGDYPGEMRMLTGPLGAEQVALTWRRMPQHTGGKGGYGHRHKSQEELYFVLEGELQFKLGDDVIDVPARCAGRRRPGGRCGTTSPRRQSSSSARSRPGPRRPRPSSSRTSGPSKLPS